MTVSAVIKKVDLPTEFTCAYQLWVPQEPRALLIALHDAAGSSHRMQRLAHQLVSQHIASGLYDQRGHGLSSGRRGDAQDFHELVDDLRAFIDFIREQTPLGIPLFLLGHGAGALVAMELLTTYNKGIAGLIAVDPTLSEPSTASVWQQRGFSLVQRVAPGLRLSSQAYAQLFGVDLPISDAQTVTAQLSVRMVSVLQERRRLSSVLAHRLQLPVLFVQGDADSTQVVATKSFLGRLPMHMRSYQQVRGDALEQLDVMQLCQWLMEHTHDQRGQVSSALQEPLWNPAGSSRSSS